MMDMATDEADANARNTRVKLAFQLAVHVPFWALVFLISLALGGAGNVRAAASSEHVAMVVGFSEIFFGLIALGFGICAGYLHSSEEADDLLRERRALLLGAGALICAGSSLILMSVAGPDRLVPAAVGFSGALLLNVCSAILVAIRLRGMDELNRDVARNAGHLAFTWFFWVGGTWAMLAHLGFVSAAAALDWLTMFHGFSFVAGLVAFACKGGFTALPSGPHPRKPAV
jgi:hypothetical protein